MKEFIILIFFKKTILIFFIWVLILLIKNIQTLGLAYILAAICWVIYCIWVQVVLISPIWLIPLATLILNKSALFKIKNYLE